ncbi:hypothetical protein D3C86_880160 [compost metagenome]
MSGGISVTSSRNSVPPLAYSKYPAFCDTAPVKLPFSWPNSSAWASVPLIAPQLTATKGWLRRSLAS